jgi:hypothetical protein
MSMTRFTVKELKEFIKDLPDNTLVVSTNCGQEHWVDEGMFDGIEPYVTDNLWEVRTGFIPTNDGECTYGKVLVLSDFDEETNIEWWNDHVEDRKLENLKVGTNAT